MKWEINSKQVTAATGGKIISRQATAWEGVATDTRKNISGRLFVALRGDRFDAHDFLQDAYQKGATGIIVDRLSPLTQELKEKVTLIQVPDTLRALQDLAFFWRQSHSARVVAITGSTGKTTTKEFAAQILQSHFKTHWSQGSYNNHWGVPLTLLSMPPDTEVVVIEMGMNHSGEITRLCEIAKPDVTVVTNVGSAHIGELGSQEAVVQAKWEIYRHSPQSIGIYNLDHAFTRRMYDESQRENRSLHLNDKLGKQIIFTFGHNGDVNLKVAATGIDWMIIKGHIGSEKGETRVPIFGRQNGENIMAACTIALSLGMSPRDIWTSLSQLKTSWGRNQLVHLPSGAKVLFDAYNANPESMKALLENFAQIVPLDFSSKREGEKYLVLGEMLELGKETPFFHEKLGEMAGEIGAALIWFIGPHQENFARGVRNTGYQKKLMLSESYQESLAIQIGSMLNGNDIVAIKGSRGMKLEQVLKAWNPINFL